jgi:hypothetical protein
VINNLKEDSNKQIDEVRNQHSDKKVSNMGENFNKDIEILEKNQTKMLEMKSSINQIFKTQ